MRCISIANELSWTLLRFGEVEIAEKGSIVINLDTKVTIVLRYVLQWLLLVVFRVEGWFLCLCDWAVALTFAVQLCHLIELSVLVALDNSPPDLFTDVNLL